MILLRERSQRLANFSMSAMIFLSIAMVVT